MIDCYKVDFTSQILANQIDGNVRRKMQIVKVTLPNEYGISDALLQVAVALGGKISDQPAKLGRLRVAGELKAVLARDDELLAHGCKEGLLASGGY